MAVAAPTIIQKPAHSNNYTSGRVGGRNGQFTFHHVVGSADSAVTVFQNPNRQASATYIVTATPGVVYQAVSEANTSWADGNLASNRRSITVEHHGDWRNGYRNDVVIQNAAQLVAWLRDRGIINHYYRHRDVSNIATQCSADLPCDEIWNRATKIIEDSNKPVAPPVTSANLIWTKLDKTETYILNKQPTILWSFDKTKHSDMTKVKDFNKGDKVEIYGKVENKTVNSTYLLTEYSFTQKIANGFNQSDLDLYQAPVPEPEKPEWIRNYRKIEPLKLIVLVEQTPVINLNDDTVVKQLGRGTWIDFVATTTVNNKEYLISQWSADREIGNGIYRDDVGLPEDKPNEKPEWWNSWEDIEDIDMYARCDTDLINLYDGKKIKQINRGDKVRVLGTIEWFSHKVAVINNKDWYGIRLDDLDKKPIEDGNITPDPIQPEIEDRLSWLEKMVKKIIIFLERIFSGFNAEK